MNRQEVKANEWTEVATITGAGRNADAEECTRFLIEQSSQEAPGLSPFAGLARWWVAEVYCKRWRLNKENEL